MRQLRALLRHRSGLVRLGTQLQNRIHAVAAGLRLRPDRELLDRARPRLAGRAGPARELPRDRHRLPGGYRRPGAADRADRRRAAPARQGRPRVKVLRTLPGAGEFTALVMAAEIGDITRFPSARKLAS